MALRWRDWRAATIHRPSRLALALVFALAAAVPAQIQIRRPPQQQLPQDTGPPKKPGSVEGTVTNSVTKSPVKKATISLRNLPGGFSYVAASDASGHFRFDNVEPSPAYTITATAPGFTAAGESSVFTSRSVGEEEHVTGVSLRLLPLGVIAGKVTDADGVPMRGVTVQAMRFEYQRAGRRIASRGMSATDDRGDYRLFDLQPGRYYLEAVRRSPLGVNQGIRVHSDLPEEAYPGTFYAGAADISGAMAIEVAAGAEVSGIDFQLHKVRAYRIRGTAVDAQTRQPVHGADVVAQSCAPGEDYAGFGANGVATLQPDGSFEVRGAVPGVYCLTVGSNPIYQISFARQVVTLPEHDLEGVILEVKGAFQVKGSVQVEGPPPDHLNNLRVIILPADNSGARVANTMVKDDGSFVLQNVLPTMYQIQNMPAPKGAYLKSIRVGDQDAPSGRLDFTFGPAPLTLVFASDPGQISVSVRNANGEPAPRSLVTVVPEGQLAARQDLFRIGFSGPDGSTSLPGLAPGDYKVLAWAESDAGMLESAEFQSAFGSRAASVTVQPNSQQSVQVTLVSSEEIAEVQKKLR